MSESLTDTHCHLFLPQFAEDLDQTLSRANAAGVGKFLVPGIDLVGSRQAVKLAESRPGLYAAVGIHPHAAQTWSSEAESALRELARSSAVKAIGEIGLDYYREFSPRVAQREALAAQLSLAAEFGLPVIVHNRQAIEDLLPVLIEWSGTLDQARRGRAGVLHAYSGELDHALAAISAGFYIGVAGPLTYPRARKLRRVVQGLPLERLLLETDSPYLPPQSHRGKRNEPGNLPQIASALSDLLGTELEPLVTQTSQNAAVLFNLNHGNHHSHLH